MMSRSNAERQHPRRRKRRSTAAQREAAASRKWKQRLLDEAGAFEVKVIVNAEHQDALAESGYLDDFTKGAVEAAIQKVLDALIPIVTP